MADVVNKLWGFCHTLRHDGVDYGDYIEQLTYLLFLKMADEKGVEIPSYKVQKTAETRVCDWSSLKVLSGTDLVDHYGEILRTLREAKGLLGEIFSQAMPRFNNPVNLKKLVNLIDEEDWAAMDVDVKGAAFEGLLEKAASEGKKGAGQYFTPRPLIQSIVNVLKPDPTTSRDLTICDPACGTGGFLICAYEWLNEKFRGAFDRDVAKRIRTKTYFGQELVARPRRLTLMNLYLHGIEPTIYLGDSIYEPDRGERYDVILSNPPFGTKGASQVPERQDFTVETSSKQLNFIQHIISILKPGGRAAIVLPDNCLFEDKAGEVFKIVMEDCDVHTILRLPRGTFTPYSQGVKANVVFLQKGKKTENVWIYDCRANIPGITKKDRPLTLAHFEEFEKCYGASPDGSSKRKDLGEEGRFRKFTIDRIKERNYNLHITWLKDETGEDDEALPPPSEIANDIVGQLTAAMTDLKAVVNVIGLSDCDESAANLPNGWLNVTVEDVAEYNPKHPKDTDDDIFVSFVPMPLISESSPKIGEHGTRRFGDVKKGYTHFADGDVLIAKITPCFENGKAAIASGLKNGMGCGTTELHVLRPTQAVLAEYLFYFLHREEFRKVAKTKMTGTAGQLRVPSDLIKTLEIPIPPIQEQYRIVEKIAELLPRIEAAKARLDALNGIINVGKSRGALDRFAESILVQAFKGALVPQDPKDEPASALLERIKAASNSQSNGSKPKRTRKSKEASVSASA